MAEPPRGERRPRGQQTSYRATLGLTLIFVLAAISVSAGLVVYTAWRHDLENGPFAVLFAVLSAKAVLSWLAWNDQDHQEHLRSTEGHKQA